MEPDSACKGCGHPNGDHYRGPDPDYQGLDSMYCAEDGCLCWNRYAISRLHPGPLTLERKPPRQTGARNASSCPVD